MEYAFELADERPGRIISATKSNGIVHTMPFWDEVVAERAAEYPDVHWDSEHIDALAAKFVLQPQRFDVVVASNLFGDILTDLAAAIQGGMGTAASANIAPGTDTPGLFEPVHGSAPDIMGKGIANPVGAVWSAVLMLEHLGEHAASARLAAALDAVCADGPRTGDVGGSGTTSEVGDALAAYVAGS